LSKPLALSDLRALRWHLESDDFAISEGPEFVPRGKIDKEVWQGIVGLPDDVMIRTTDYRQNDVEHAYHVAQSWHDVMKSLPKGPLDTQAFSVYENLETSLFNALAGWYRTAGLALRAASDDLLVGLFYQTNRDRRGEFDAVVEGKSASPPFREIREWLSQLSANSLFDHPNGAYRKLYDRLSVYTHRISNNAMWESNGPIYATEAFDRWLSDYFDADSTLRRAIEVMRPHLIKREPRSKGR
jgi:hypothetical protein